MEQEPHELTSALHLSTREISTTHPARLEEYVASLTDIEREVIAEIQSSGRDKAMVLIHRGVAKGSRFLITGQGATIGRSIESAVFLDDVTVSRSHALIERIGDIFQLRDCGSLNGTYLNNDSISQRALNSGDEIQIGKFHLLFVTGTTKVESGQ